jgi:hypothetical protein
VVDVAHHFSPAPDRSPYHRLLALAYDLGRADGRFARAFEAPGSDRSDDCCAGRTPQQFAALLWAGRPGAAPSGLGVNAPLWYAAGFREGLADRVEAREAGRTLAHSRRRRPDLSPASHLAR